MEENIETKEEFLKRVESYQDVLVFSNDYVLRVSKKDLLNPYFREYCEERKNGFIIQCCDTDLFFNQEEYNKLVEFHHEMEKNEVFFQFVEPVFSGNSSEGMRIIPLTTSFVDVQKTNLKLRIIADKINSGYENKNGERQYFSPLEKYCLCYKWVSGLQFKFVDDEKGKLKDRLKTQSLVNTILKNEGCCAGKSAYLVALLKMMGLDACSIAINTEKCYDIRNYSSKDNESESDLCNHAITLIYLKDDKYNVNGLFAGDTCFKNRYAVASTHEELERFLETGMFLNTQSVQKILDFCNEVKKGHSDCLEEQGSEMTIDMKNIAKSLAKKDIGSIKCAENLEQKGKTPSVVMKSAIKAINPFYKSLNSLNRKKVKSKSIKKEIFGEQRITKPFSSAVREDLKKLEDFVYKNFDFLDVLAKRTDKPNEWKKLIDNDANADKILSELADDNSEIRKMNRRLLKVEVSNNDSKRIKNSMINFWRKEAVKYQNIKNFMAKNNIKWEKNKSLTQIAEGSGDVEFCNYIANNFAKEQENYDVLAEELEMERERKIKKNKRGKKKDKGSEETPIESE